MLPINELFPEGGDTGLRIFWEAHHRRVDKKAVMFRSIRSIAARLHPSVGGHEVLAVCGEFILQCRTIPLAGASQPPRAGG
jgi:hypothetical protein